MKYKELTPINIIKWYQKYDTGLIRYLLIKPWRISRIIWDDVIQDDFNCPTIIERKIKIAEQLGLSMNNIILDPGIGFGKRIQDNNKIILHLDKIKKFNLPILIGLSRKSFLSIDGDDSNDRLATTIAASVLAIQNGADILRVHDVKETYKLIKILSSINNDK